MNLKFYALLFLISISGNLFSQQLCHTPASTNNGFLNNSTYLKSANNNNSYCLKVYFHIIRKDDGSLGQSVGTVNDAFQILNEDFLEHNIGQYSTNGITNNYVLDIETNQTTINISNYANGFYTVALVCDGEIIDAKSLIKQ